MLRGDQLLAAVAAEPGASRSELVRRCGYVHQAVDGREQLLFSAFYEALLDAKGLRLPGRHGRSESRSEVSGRRLNFNTHVHFNGNLMVGRAYVEKLRLKPGDQLKIHLEHGQIRLVPINQA